MHWIWTWVSALSGGSVRTRGPRGGNRLYLTFDDGPHPQHTPALLDLLAAHGVKATFFTVGRHVQAHPQIARRILDEGHTLGNHSMTHARMETLAPPEQMAEVRSAEAVLRGISGQARHLFRPPHGKGTPTLLLNSFLRRHPLVLWTVDSLDYTLGAQAVVTRLSRQPLRDGDIVLFHDDGQVALDALRELLPQWRAANLRMHAL